MSTPTVRDRVVELRRVRAGDLMPNAKNWRTHPGGQRSAVRAALAEIGYSDALLARETPEGLQLIDGHLRRELTPDEIVPVLIVDLNEDEADKLLVTLDPLAGMAGTDLPKLEALLSSLDFELPELRDVALSVLDDARPPPDAAVQDEVPEPPVVPETKPGDLYLLGEHRLLCGDATSVEDVKRACGGESPTCMWTDPPYGVSYVGGTKDALEIQGDDAAGLPALLAEAFGAANSVLIDGAAVYVAHPAGALSWEFLVAFRGAGWRLHQTLAWVKDAMVLGHSDYHYRHEPILFGYTAGGGRRGRGGSGWHGDNAQVSVFHVDRPRRNEEHPTGKPVALVAAMVQNSCPRGGLILDPFCGSGTTLVAAEQLDRRCVALEIDPRYVDVAVRRWEALTGAEARRVRP